MVLLPRKRLPVRRRSFPCGTTSTTPVSRGSHPHSQIAWLGGRRRELTSLQSRFLRQFAGSVVPSMWTPFRVEACVKGNHPDPWITILAGSKKDNTAITVADYSKMIRAKDRTLIAKLIRLRFSERYLDPALDNP